MVEHKQYTTQQEATGEAGVEVLLNSTNRQSKNFKKNQNLLYSFGIQFSTKYENQTGLIHALDLRVRRFQSNTRKGAKRLNILSRYKVENGLEGLQSSKLQFSESFDITNLRSGTPVHVVFHFYDTFCDSAQGFLNFNEAKLAFSEAENNIWGKIELLREFNPDCKFCIMKHDKYQFDLLEFDEATGSGASGWARPDKGDTWWLQTARID